MVYCLLGFIFRANANFVKGLHQWFTTWGTWTPRGTFAHRRTRRGAGGGGRSPGLKNFRANSVFRATASSSKILNNKIYFSTVKNSRATLFFRASASCLKILNNKKYRFNTVNSGHPLFFRASASYSKILNVKVYSIQWKIPGQLCFQGKRRLLKTPE